MYNSYRYIIYIGVNDVGCGGVGSGGVGSGEGGVRRRRRRRRGVSGCLKRYDPATVPI